MFWGVVSNPSLLKEVLDDARIINSFCDNLTKKISLENGLVTIALHEVVAQPESLAILLSKPKSRKIFSDNFDLMTPGENSKQLSLVDLVNQNPETMNIVLDYSDLRTKFSRSADSKEAKYFITRNQARTESDLGKFIQAKALGKLNSEHITPYNILAIVADRELLVASLANENTKTKLLSLMSLNIAHHRFSIENTTPLHEVSRFSGLKIFLEDKQARTLYMSSLKRQAITDGIALGTLLKYNAAALEMIEDDPGTAAALAVFENETSLAHSDSVAASAA